MAVNHGVRSSSEPMGEEERCWTLGVGPTLPSQSQQSRSPEMIQASHRNMAVAQPDVRDNARGDGLDEDELELYRRFCDAETESPVLGTCLGVDVSKANDPIQPPPKAAIYRSFIPTRLSLEIPSRSSSSSTPNSTSRNKKPPTHQTAGNNPPHTEPRKPPGETHGVTGMSPPVVNRSSLRPSETVPPARGPRLAEPGVRRLPKLGRLSGTATPGIRAGAAHARRSEGLVLTDDFCGELNDDNDAAEVVMTEEKKRAVVVGEVEVEVGRIRANSTASASSSRQQLDRRRPQHETSEQGHATMGLGTIDRILDDFPGGAELHAAARHPRAISPPPSTLDPNPNFNGRTTPSSLITACGNRDSRISWGSISTLCDEEGRNVNRASLTKFLAGGPAAGEGIEKFSPVTEEDESSPSSAHQRPRQEDSNLPTITVHPTFPHHSSSPPKTPINTIGPGGGHVPRLPTYPSTVHYAKSDPNAISSHILTYAITPSKNHSSRSSRTLINITPSPPPSPPASTSPPRSPILPPKTPHKPLRELRYILLIVYRRLFSLLLALNLLALLLLLFLPSPSPAEANRRTTRWTAHLATINLTLAVLVRQDHVVNFLYWLFCTVPRRTWPLWIRTQCAKIYHLGGVHSGAATCSVAWFAGSVSLAMRSPNSGTATLIISWFGLSLLVTMVISATPRVRKRYHNRFELVHRFAGWSALAVFWAQNISALNDARTTHTLAHAVVRSPDIWCLILVTLSIASSWFRLRRVPVEPEVLSSHAVRLWFRYGQPLPGSFTRMSSRPLVEWHSFAAIPVLEERETGISGDLEKGMVVREKTVTSGVGYSVIVSNAGDWTERQIQNPPRELWVRGLPTCGVMHIARLFTRLVLIGTGSGIGPLLSHLQLPCPSHRGPVRLIWSTPSPRATFGDRLCDAVLQADSEAVIHDTKRLGRPDLVKMGYKVARNWGAEAVVVIANERVTKKVVYGLRTRGVECFGAIWDS